MKTETKTATKTETERPSTSKKRKMPAHSSRGWTEEQKQLISELAYQHFLARGGEHGYHMEDWLRAEAELIASLPPARKRRPTDAKN